MKKSQLLYLPKLLRDFQLVGRRSTTLQRQQRTWKTLVRTNWKHL